jgi:hypothetical protein
VARGRIAARQPRTHCAPRAPSSLLLSPLVRVNFVSVLRMVLRLRSAEKSKKFSEISHVTLLQLESEFLFAYLQLQKAPQQTCARRRERSVSASSRKRRHFELQGGVFRSGNQLEYS